MKKITLKLLSLYKKYISEGILSVVYLGDCRFQPTCSEYTYQAVGKYGTIKGLILGVKRILHCNPLFKGGDHPLR